MMTTEFALNYSDEAAGLLAARRIAFDRFKVPDWPEQIATAIKLRPVYAHFPLHAGVPITSDMLDRVARMRDQTHTPFVNIHAVAWSKDFTAADAAVAAMHRGVQAVVERFGGEHVVVENIPLGDPDEGFHPACGGPALMHGLLQRHGCRFLLDLSHARLTARYLGVDARGFVEMLPVDQLAELHLTGLAMVNGKLKDHMPLSDADWHETQWAFGQIAAKRWSTPRLVACEYGGTGPAFKWRSDAAVIAEQIPRLVEMTQHACAR